jgi:prolyl-tRNA synthetase
MLGVYAEFAETDAAIPVIQGRKSDAEKFAGAVRSYSIEAMMGDLRALQAGTSHNLGTNFARAFGIRYLDRANNLQDCHTTSWGLSWRVIGAMVMVHGDDQGLRLPPRLAPIQVVIVPIYRNEEERAAVTAAVERVRLELQGLRVRVDNREGLTPGFKFHDWEMRGVPIRAEVGPRDAAAGTVALARRDVPGKGGKSTLPQEGLGRAAAALLEEIHQSLFQQALEFRRSHTYQPADYEEFKVAVQQGWADVWWCGDPTCEAEIKEETKATNRCIPLEQAGGQGVCIHCGKPARERAIFARAY